MKIDTNDHYISPDAIDEIKKDFSHYGIEAVEDEEENPRLEFGNGQPTCF